VDDVAAFFKTYYAPNNAVLSVVGDVDTRTVLAKVEQYFGSIPSQPAPPKVDMAEPPQTEERRLTLDDPLARLPRIDMAYKIPPSMSPDDDALTVLGTILSGGRSSRFTEHIVRQKQLATSVFAGSDDARGPGLFNVVGTAAPGKPLADLEAAIEEEIEKVKKGPIADWEMDKARNGARSQFISSLGSSFQRAVLLGQYALFYDNPDLINTRADKIAKVTAADVQRVAAKYLVRTGRTVVLSVPKGSTPSKGDQR
jgi:predicted Zn-dependent peptidase